MRKIVIVLCTLALTLPVFGKVLRVAEMTVDEIRKLDRARTAVILPGGILEQHASHLPSFSDGYLNTDVAESLAESISAREGWTALLFPIIPLGSGGANEISGKYSWPGTYAVRVDTLRSIFMDLGTELGEQGFRWVFIVHNHGSPWHNLALDEAGDYFRDTYGGVMVNLQGLEPDWSTVGKARGDVVSKETLEEDADSVHAGLSETSRVMYLRPDLVKPVAGVKSITTPMPKLVETARAEGWPGYFGAPRHASAALGRIDQETAKKLWIDMALQILRGTDPKKFPRYADMMLAIPPIANMGKGSIANDAAIAERQRKWLEKKRAAKQ
jgi:creatinine amidohydrolase/Fe(II)-dependent formamide hydrolase-like protein